ncbi:TRAP transporter permease [Minwuia sp.]|uniref:TRAP transporter permease n=1 Tax=Minwuia sp. TaxID=2493630 RepID=UPI003A8D613C
MSDKAAKGASGGGLSDAELDDLVASTDTGGRKPDSRVLVKLIAGLALAWSLFQLWFASPIPSVLSSFEATRWLANMTAFNSGEARSIHLSFAILLCFLSYPAFKGSPRNRIPAADWALAIVGASCAFYLFLFSRDYMGWVFGSTLSDRPANPNQVDILVAVVGVLVLLEATRRSLGPPLAIVAMIFIGYTFLGPYAPGLLAWKGASFGAVADHQWLSTEGVFGIALGVSTDLVFLFVLFGALLEKAGAGNYFIKVAFSLMGHLRGGPAKAAVVASAMTGLISGSSIANVVTTGTFTIPMMRRVGFSAEKAGAVEVASSVNGQIMPPVMGAAAFLMVEYVGISYFEVVKHAFVPAVISYIALVYIVHLEAMKADMQGLPKTGQTKPFKWALIAFLSTAISFFIVAGAIGWVMTAFLAIQDPVMQAIVSIGAFVIIVAAHFLIRKLMNPGSRWKFMSTGALVLGYAVVASFLIFYVLAGARALLGDGTGWFVAIALAVAYVFLLRHGTKFPQLTLDDPNAPVTQLPEPGPTINAGLFYLLPVLLLIWCLMVERLSPTTAAFYATLLMIVILLTQNFLKAMFRKENTSGTLKQGFDELIDGLITGARNMIGIGIATATAGIIVGAVSQTGVGAVLAALVEFLSQGNILAILLLTGILSLILGMGLPTTANYIVVSSLLAPVIVTLGQQNGLIVPLIAVHLFVFYFGIMADVTPPVGLASFAAAAVSGGDPIRTGFVAFFYSLRTALLPFLFIFNTSLILYEVTPLEAVPIFIIATAAMLIFTAGMQGFFFARNRVWESLALILIAFTLFRPGFWMDQVVPPYQNYQPAQLVEVVGQAEPGEKIRLEANGLDDVGEPVSLTLIIEVPEGESGEERLQTFGIDLLEQDGKLMIDGASFDSAAEKAGFDFDQEVLIVKVPSDQPPRELFFIPALLLLGLIYWLQKRRMPRAPTAAPQTAREADHV